MANKEIAVTIQNMVQFYSIKNGIDELIKHHHQVDIYIPKITGDFGYETLFNDTYKKNKFLTYKFYMY